MFPLTDPVSQTDQFRVVSRFQPRGDQEKAISFLSDGIRRNLPYQTLLGVTGSGKTFTMVKIIEACQRPSLVIAHNKTLAAQLFREFKRFLPDNAVHYFVSYYDYYQPEAYIPSSDLYIEKDASINDELDRMRHAATQALIGRSDVVIVASVSCIYGLGSPSDYTGLLIKLTRNMKISRRRLLERLVDLQYSRNDTVLARGKFRVRGDTVEIFGIGDDDALRVEFFGDEIDGLSRIDPLRGQIIRKIPSTVVFPATHYVTLPDRMPDVLTNIRRELDERLGELDSQGKLLERQRLKERTEFDLEMLELTGYCTGIENYSRHLTGRAPGEAPPTLLDYLPVSAIVFIDESHVTIPQLKAMYRGDHSRKRVLVEHGFRLPSAVDNRPLTFDEFSERVPSVVFVSATPTGYEIEMSRDRIAEQLLRPTGLTDPEVEIRPAQGQIDDLYEEIRKRVDRKERVLVTTLTKKMAEDLTDYYRETGLKVCYLHSEIDTLERVKIIRQLRLGVFDVLIGVNLLREGLDLPEVSLVAILDADQEGFLRSTTSLVQTIGRCARHIDGRAILYADTVTGSIRSAVEETSRRREIQEDHNRRMGITPESIESRIDDDAFAISESDYVTVSIEPDPSNWTPEEYDREISRLEKEMFECAAGLKYEEAARIRDRIREIRRDQVSKPRSG
ncbi:excinuclease ABC subunit UvrB [bacterium]|nr:excinuclease ABC subunit UvrB [candidate division CSSED10-310 bacterium]